MHKTNLFCMSDKINNNFVISHSSYLRPRKNICTIVLGFVA